MVITVVLVLATAIMVFIQTRKDLGLGVCLYEGIEYTENQPVPNYDGGRDCYCSWQGEIVCQEPELTMSYETFSSTGLAFSYEFKNFLNQSTPN